MWATLRKHAAIATEIVALFHARFDPRLEVTLDQRGAPRGGDPGAHRGGAAAGRQPRRGPHPAALRQRGRSGDAHQFLPDRRKRSAEGGDRRQVREPQHRRDAGAATAVRDLRLFAARRRRAPAVRQGRARRPALVRPAAGLPHRGARAGQGAAGEERAHRTGRRQGRVRAQAAACRRRTRGDPDRGRRRLHDFRLEPARRHRQSRAGRRDRAAAQRRAPRQRRSLPGGRRRQGYRDLLRHRQRASPPNTASGSTTRSPRAARPATTTRRWASRRAAPGRRSSAISASSTSTS